MYSTDVPPILPLNCPPRRVVICPPYSRTVKQIGVNSCHCFKRDTRQCNAFTLSPYHAQQSVPLRNNDKSHSIRRRCALDDSPYSASSLSCFSPLADASCFVKNTCCTKTSNMWWNTSCASVTSRNRVASTTFFPPNRATLPKTNAYANGLHFSVKIVKSQQNWTTNFILSCSSH